MSDLVGPTFVRLQKQIILLSRKVVIKNQRYTRTTEIAEIGGKKTKVAESEPVIKVEIGSVYVAGPQS